MRVLYYNWVDYEDAQKRGGGVTVYQRNLVDAATRAGDEVAFLSSGIAYGLIRRKPRIRRVRGSRVGVRKYEIVNSPILSPGSLNFEGDALAHPVMEELFADFLKREGPFDAIHFNNLEGIPASFATVARHHAPRGEDHLELAQLLPLLPSSESLVSGTRQLHRLLLGKEVRQLPSPRAEPRSVAEGLPHPNIATRSEDFASTDLESDSDKRDTQVHPATLSTHQA